MKVKTSELQGAALNWVVTQIESGAGPDKAQKQWRYFGRVFQPTTNRDQGYEIVEREGIHLLCNDDLTEWTASSPRKNMVGWRLLSWGPTPLVAAMRCYVASKLGNEVDIPDELTQLGETV